MRRPARAAIVLLTACAASTVTACSGGSPSGSGPSAGSSASRSAGPSALPSSGPSALPSPGTAGTSPGLAATGPTSGTPAGTAPPVAAGQAARFTAEVSARISGVSVRTVRAELRGETSGPAVTFRLTIRNESGRPLDLDNVVVVATDAARRPLPPVSGTFARDLTGSVEPGGSRSGTYAFTLSPTIGEAARRPVSVTVAYSAGVRTVRFTGLLS